MAGFDRTTRIAGPAKITYKTVDIFTKGDIIVRPRKKKFKVEVDAFGTVDNRIDDRDLEITFTPDGRWSNSLGGKTVLFPGGIVNSVDDKRVVGDSWIGASDNTLVITPIKGKPLTFGNAVITKIPSLIFSAVQTLIGPVTFRALNINAQEWSDAASLWTLGSSGTVTDFTGYAVADIITKGYKLLWTGKTGFTGTGAAGIDTESGISVDFDLQLEERPVDSYGVTDLGFVSLDVIAKAKPVGLAEADYLAALKMQDTGAARGASDNAGSADLVVKDLSGTVIFTGNSMNLDEDSGELHYGARSNRNGDMSWRTSLELNLGAIVAPFNIA